MLFKIIGFIFTWIFPFGVVWVNHIILTEKKYDVDMFGLMLVLALLLGLLKFFENKMKIWEIQNKKRLLRVHWSNLKRVFLAVMLTWVLYTIEDNLPKMQWTAVLISASFILGWLFTTLGNIKKRSV